MCFLKKNDIKIRVKNRDPVQVNTMETDRERDERDSDIAESPVSL